MKRLAVTAFDYVAEVSCFTGGIYFCRKPDKPVTEAVLRQEGGAFASGLELQSKSQHTGRQTVPRSQRQSGSSLQHVATISSIQAENVSASIPPVHVQAKIFTALNGLAILRELHGHRLPAEEARPAGASCFGEWVVATNPRQTLLSC